MYETAVFMLQKAFNVYTSIFDKSIDHNLRKAVSEFSRNHKKKLENLMKNLDLRFDSHLKWGCYKPCIYFSQ